MVRPAGPAADVTLQKMSRYRSVREAKSVDRHEKALSPQLGATSDQNPSIARSMSRYRRNRPSANNTTTAPINTPAPPLPDLACAKAQRVSPSPDAKLSPSAQEERAREKHRQDAMAQLEGEKQSSAEITLRPVKSEKHVRVKKDVGKTKLTRSAPTAADVESRRASAHAPSHDNTRKSFFQKMGLTKAQDSAPKYIGVGGGGIVPGIDAPISAVNAGERQVLVQYSDALLKLSVTPSTQVQDLLLSASQKLSRDIDPEKFIVRESFHQVGLERNLREYERVRDVMNSWSHDADNRLIIIPPSSMDALAQLDAHLVPSEKPAETSVYLYYSQRPGKWDKRWVTLYPNGQVTIAKKESSKDPTAICHLSDFDIYKPNARALAKEIKPPKKICIAIKSQQKSSMFLSTEKFVHFFSTNDSAMADKWFTVTQAWRSWYLVNKMGATEKSDAGIPLPLRSLTNRQNAEMGPRPSTAKDVYAHKKSSRDHAPPPSSFPKDLAIDTLPGRPSAEMDTTTFSPTGLLGRSYSQRKQAMHERDERAKRAKEEPFTEQGLLNERPLNPPDYSNSRTNTMTRAPDGLSPSLSVSQKPKPLIDLTPIFQEAPQHVRKGRGVTVEPGVKLVDAATGPELAVNTIVIPPATSWRRPSVEVAPPSRNRSNTARSVRQVASPHKSSQLSSAEGSPIVPSNPFQPNSLLTSEKVTSQPKLSKRRGVATGDRNATQPMLDLSPENPFAEGSLLRQL
ncbi:hypothetical protein N7448_000187 [Penicillium atrosanguineum]|uniref:PH domain-containing protein n=1 Tax=Penicillium atrosanguineum TaxID=1132637 RepID=A0A9W9U893_9EURO|nr:MFS transporter [Penicillium atrosanguineum]KAJ5134792.1 hypothetical protein N7526_006157 [Penicillium atrosanguineum]KAJ5148609.1 hypothetical protein N7448_000187 [Penicillium atrosanguineum]KAJ5303927.1 MFS transporter [Penicillium atrosanguineum]KAJ5323403.1 hypothetical protein N7476_002003 [Penicillium atrosanguineum]